jgi:hypothetical protein
MPSDVEHAETWPLTDYLVTVALGNIEMNAWGRKTAWDKEAFFIDAAVRDAFRKVQVSPERLKMSWAY